MVSTAMAVLPVCLSPQDQFALATPDRNKGVNDFEPGLKRDGNRRPVHDVGRRALDRQPAAGRHRA